MKQTYFRRLLALGLNISLLAFFLVVPADAAEVPESGIDYDQSYVYFLYTPEPEPDGAPAPWRCFDASSTTTLPSGIRLGYAPTSLERIGITSTAGLSNIAVGSGTNECFQQSGTYYMQFLLQDEAGNAAFFPNTDAKDVEIPYNPSADFPAISAGNAPDDPDWYKFVVKPATPDADVTEEATVTPYTGTAPLPADGSQFYDVAITLKDEFGNVVTQIDDPSHVDLRLITGPETVLPIEGYNNAIDGIYDQVSPTENIQHDREGTDIFDGSNERGDQLDSPIGIGLKIGDGTINQPLMDLASQANKITNVTVNNGVISFRVLSDVPTMKLVNGDPEQGSGVYKLPLVFDPKTRPIDNDGSVDTVGSFVNIEGDGQVPGFFSFHPVQEVEPEITATNILLGTPVENIKLSGLVSDLKALFWTPRNESILKKEKEVVDAAGVPSNKITSPDLWEFNGANDTRDGLDDGNLLFDNFISETISRLLFLAPDGSLSSTLSSVSLGTMVEYAIVGIGTIRHHSKGTSDGLCPTGFESTYCYKLGTGIGARFIGADIEGAFQGERSEILVYQIDDAATNIGNQTSYAGTINNDRLRNGLFRSIDNAVRNPEQPYGSSDSKVVQNFDTITFGSSTGVAVVHGDLVLNTITDDEAPSGKNTVIVVDGNVYVEDDYWYSDELNDSLGIITYNTDVQRNDGEAPEFGNVFVDENVKHMVGTYYIDGSLVSLGSTAFADIKNGTVSGSIDTINDLSYDLDKLNQLVLEGVIWSGNTLGGALIDSGSYASPWHNNGTEDIGTARLFDLHYARRYAGGSDCTPDSNGPSTCDSNTNAFVIRLDNKATYPNTAPPVFRDLPEIAQ